MASNDLGKQVIQNFLSGQKQATGDKQLGKTVIADFLAKNPKNITTKKVVNEEPINKNPSAFQWIGKQLMKPVGATAVFTKGVADFGVNVAQGNFNKAGTSMGNALGQGLDVLAGKKETSFSKELQQARDARGGKTNTLDKAFGIGADMFLDPLNLVNPTKVAGTVLNKTGLAKPLSNLGKVVKETTPAKKLATLFSNSTGNKEFDAILQKFRALASYREGELVDDARNLNKEFLKLGKNKADDVVRGLEDANFRATLDAPTLNIVNQLKTRYASLLDEGRSVGLNIGEILEYAPRIRTKESFLGKLKGVGLGAKEFGDANIQKGRAAFPELTQAEIAKIPGYETYFEKNPIVQLIKKGQAYTKAITSKQFADEVAKFATDDGVEVTNSLLKGKKFAPEMAKVIDNYYTAIKPEELNTGIRAYDAVLNWWKGQALLSPAYHVRNMAGNFWNNFLAGVGPQHYAKATAIQAGNDPDGVLQLAKKLGSVRTGQFEKDIAQSVTGGIKGGAVGGLNPLSQQNYLFKGNRAIGGAIEDNAKLAHFVAMLDKGMTPEQAAASVRKYLFDYGDLTKVERTIFKRVIPFYTWTRKNVPLQVEEFFKQPGKFATIPKVVNAIESNVQKPDEKFMNAYIKENAPVRIRTDKNNNTEYFMLGNWLPAASALDVLSNPPQAIREMISPIFKGPVELWANKSGFFKDTLGRPAPIENYPGEQGEFLGKLRSKKQINVLRNFRILNDIDKFIQKKDKSAENQTTRTAIYNLLFGKAALYDVGKSKYFYDRDTNAEIDAIKKAIKNAQRKNYPEEVDALQKKLQKFKQERFQ